MRRLAKHCLVKTEHFEFTHCFAIFSTANLFMAHVFHLNQYLKCRIVLKKVFSFQRIDRFNWRFFLLAGV